MHQIVVCLPTSHESRLFVYVHVAQIILGGNAHNSVIATTAHRVIVKPEHVHAYLDIWGNRVTKSVVMDSTEPIAQVSMHHSFLYTHNPCLSN